MMWIGFVGGPASSDQTIIDSQSKAKMVVVSWYGEELHGSPMANGERFDKRDPTTVAHKELPFGTLVELTNPETGQTLTVEVRDRGPFARGRTFDLSEAGAEKLGFKDKGVTSLESRVVLQPD
ncbi:MAG: septal ring lytic transglycosylase RlpA family protein [Candidatus Vogelbacteria bacterium]|nr:septal ring lytic transglycosylase RlpA family protein [Candidatus Vogelbacteria bacterium]